MFRALLPVQPSRSNPFAALQHDMNRLLESSFHDMVLPASDRVFLTPSMDVKETEKAIEVATELPGVDQKDVTVTYAEGVLTIKGEKKAEKEEMESGYHLSERSYGSFMRSLHIDDVAADKIEASFNNGVLKVVLPKVPPAQSKAKTIAIKPSS